MKIQAFSHYCVLSVSVKPPKNMISVVQVRGSVVALGGCTAGCCFHLLNPSVFCWKMTVWSLPFSLRVILLVPCPNFFSLPFFLKNPVIKKDLREGKFTCSSFLPGFPSLLPVATPADCPGKAP